MTLLMPYLLTLSSPSRDQQQRLLVFLAGLVTWSADKIDRIVQSRFAARIDVIERIDQIADAAGEILFEICGIIEVDDERLVVRIALAHERQRGAVHALAFVPHAAAVVDDESKAERNVFVSESLDRLLDFVFEDLEMSLVSGRRPAGLLCRERIPAAGLQVVSTLRV